jgi:hypothetical protein
MWKFPNSIAPRFFGACVRALRGEGGSWVALKAAAKHVWLCARRDFLSQVSGLTWRAVLVCFFFFSFPSIVVFASVSQISHFLSNYQHFKNRKSSCRRVLSMPEEEMVADSVRRQWAM